MRRLPGIAVLLAGALAGAGLIQAADWLLFERDPRAILPPCFAVGPPEHHRFRPDCKGLLQTPDGPVPLETNEDGLRELPRSKVLGHPRRVLLLGDSFVEGWWAAQFETLAPLLNQELPDFYFVNGGLRSTGPRMQATRLARLLPRYRPEAILWFLDDTDYLDDSFTCQVTENPAAEPGSWIFQAPEFQLTGWRKQVAGLLGESALGGRLRRSAYAEKWRSLAEAPQACEPCGGIAAVKQLAAAAAVPLHVFYIETLGEAAHYAGMSAGRAKLRACLAALKLEPFLVGPPTPPPGESSPYQWKGDFHLNPAGLALLAGQVRSAVAPQLARKAPRAPRRRGR